MLAFFLILEALVGVILVALILLQPPKGDGFGAIGGQARMFDSSSRALNSGISQLTFAFAIVFYLLALFLGVFL